MTATLRLALLSLILAAALLTAACGGAEGETWLHGTWTLAYNPGHDSEDELTFKPDGTVSIRTADDHRIQGSYRVKDRTLLLRLDVKGEEVAVPFEIAPDRARLTYETGAYYTRRAAAP